MRLRICWLVFSISARQIRHSVTTALVQSPALALVPVIVLVAVGLIQYQLVRYFGELAGKSFASEAVYRVLAIEQLAVLLSLTIVVLFATWTDRRAAFLRGLPLSYGEAALGWFLLPAAIAGACELVLLAPVLVAIRHDHTAMALALGAAVPSVLIPAVLAFGLAHGSLTLRTSLVGNRLRILDVGFAAMGVMVAGGMTAFSFTNDTARALSPLYWIAEVAVLPSATSVMMLALTMIGWGLLLAAFVSEVTRRTKPDRVENGPLSASRGLPNSPVLMFAVLDTRQMLRDGQSLLSNLYIGASLIGGVVFLGQIDMPKEQALGILTPIASLLISYSALTAVGRDQAGTKYLSTLPVAWPFLQGGKFLVVATQATLTAAVVIVAMAALGYVENLSLVMSFFTSVLFYTALAFLFGTRWPVRPTAFGMDDLPAFSVFSLTAYGLTAGGQYLLQSVSLGQVSAESWFTLFTLIASVLFVATSIGLRKEIVR